MGKKCHKHFYSLLASYSCLQHEAGCFFKNWETSSTRVILHQRVYHPYVTRGIKKENRQRSAAKVKRMLLSILKPLIRTTIQLQSGSTWGWGVGRNLCRRSTFNSWIGMWCVYKKSLPEVNIHVLMIEWTYSSWYKNKGFVDSWYHILHWAAVNICYVSFLKILFHRLCKVCMTANKA